MMRRRRYLAGAVLVLFGLAAAIYLDWRHPLTLPSSAPGAVVTDNAGVPLRTWPSPDGAWRYPVSSSQVSPYYLQALLGYEDRWFHWHPGVNPWALARAGWQWLRHGRIVSGGSTLSMQVARLVDPAVRENSRSLPVKLRQILRAMQLEWHLSKDEILTLYLNHAPMGGVVQGVEMASRSWLGKPSARLTHAEAALLAALPQAPSRLRPDRHPEAARQARDKVLRRMAELGLWPADVTADAMLENIIVPPLRARWLAPLAAERLHRQADAELVESTLDAELQTTVARLLQDRVHALPQHVSMAALVMDNDTLALLAYVGAADFGSATRFGYIDMSRAVRSPGSTLKPFLYAQALDEGLVHSESLLVDAPQSFGGYQPGNFQAGFSGPVSVAQALARSLNVPAVDLLDRVGPTRFASVLRAGGVRLRLPDLAEPNLSLILGGGGTTLHELVGAYRALARGGMAGEPRLNPSAPRVERRLMSEGAAFIVRDILESGGHPERPFPARHRGLAWKTGTSFGFRDAWAIGVTDSYTIGVWVGRPDGTPNPGYFGANIAAPLLADIAAALPPQAIAPLARPASVSRATICWPLGLRAELTPADQCHMKRSAWILNDAAPPTLPDRHREAGLRQAMWLDPETSLRTTPACTPGARRQEALATWPVAALPWLDSRGWSRHAPPPWLPACAPTGAGIVRITGLADNAVLRPAAGQQGIELEVGAAGNNGPVWWLLDGVATGRPLVPGPLNLRFSRNGSHTLTVLDASGRHDRLHFEIAGLGPAPP